MQYYLARLSAILSTFAFLSCHAAGADDPLWRISPERINIQVGDDRPLQILDDAAQEIHGAEWSVDATDRAEMREENGRAIMHAKAWGTVRVTATVGLEKRFRDVEIWPSDKPIPPGTTGWGMHPIGRDLKDLAAVPTPDGPNMFSLEQTADGRTYLRGVSENGIQLWSWLMPEKTREAELVCGDWLGGALISANQPNSYTLYTVGPDGKVRWQRTLEGIRKAHAYTLTHLVHLLSKSSEGTVTKLTALDEVTGEQKFELTIPPSHEKRLNVRKAGTKILCASEPTISLVRAGTSRLFVNIDGFAYVAFTQQDWDLSAPKCTPGSALDPGGLTQERNQRVVLWQIHDDGTVRRTVVEESSARGLLSDSLNVGQPTGSIIPDGLGGVLLSVGWVQIAQKPGAQRPPDEFIYRLDQDGRVVYQFPLPHYEGPLHDEMVLGETNGFVTRGSLLVAFSIADGKEMWRWDSHTLGIEVFAALANGGCLVQTPTALVQVDNATDAKELFKGKAVVDWRGQLFRQSN
jgi:outer membrane protein assembly factor BamB